MYTKYFKRPVDITAAFFGLLILSPFFAALYFLVLFKLGSPVIFKQERPGLSEEIFTLYKFRSMTDKEADRLTKFGKTLKKTSMDRLPCLFNILKGDMSLVGPAPLPAKYLPPDGVFRNHRANVRPGLTGLAQIKDKDLSSWSEKFYYDYQYVKNAGFVLDAKIIFTAIAQAIKRGRQSP